MDDGVADHGQHPPHLPVAAFIDRQLDLGLRLGRGFRRDGVPLSLCRRLRGGHRPPPRPPRDALDRLVLEHPAQMNILRRRGGAVIQHHAARQPGEVLRRGDAVYDGAVRLGDVMLRVGQLVEEVTVVGQKDQPFGVGIEPPNRAQHRLAGKVDQVRDQSRGVGVAARADHAARLVQGQVIPTGRRAHDVAVERDLVRRRVDAGAEFGDDLPVDADAAFLNPRFAGPARADPGGGEDFLEPLAGRRRGGGWFFRPGLCGSGAFGARRF